MPFTRENSGIAPSFPRWIAHLHSWRYRIAILGMFAPFLFPIWRYDPDSAIAWIAIAGAAPPGNRNDLFHLPGAPPISAYRDRFRWQGEAERRLRKYERKGSMIEKIDGIGEEASLVRNNRETVLYFRRRNLVVTVRASSSRSGSFDAWNEAETLQFVGRQLDGRILDLEGYRIQLDFFGNYLWETIVKDAWDEIADTYQPWSDPIRDQWRLVRRAI